MLCVNGTWHVQSFIFSAIVSGINNCETMVLCVVSAKHIPAINFWIAAAACLMKNNDFKTKNFK